MIWTHDLLLLSKFLKRVDTSSDVGLFLHYPFPDLETFNRFQFSSEVLKSMLCNDVIGFNYFMNAKMFIDVCVRKFRL